MRTHLTSQQIKEFIIDTIIIKSKLLLRNTDLEEFLKKSRLRLAKRILEENKEMISFRPEEVQELVSEIRIKIGDIDKRNDLELTNIIVNNEELSRDFNTILQNYINIISWHQKEFGVEESIGQEFIDRTTKTYGVSRLSVLLFLEKMSIDLNDSIGNSFSQLPFEEPIKLNDLFTSEKLPNDSFFDQRFINYLSMNSDKLDSIHWRQFEGLVAEFLKREGYEVDLNKGRNDGGVDIVARNVSKETVTIIQCKRYKKDRPISVESVKSLCFDLIDKKFASGIIVTTSYLTDGEKKIYRNKYPISEVEFSELKSWISKMFKHST